MDSSQQKNSKSRSKNWNIFRSPQQKDLFDFLDHEENYYMATQTKQEQEKRETKKSYQKQVKQIRSGLQLKENSILENMEENSWRSNMTFATRFHEESSSKIISNRNKQFKASSSRNINKYLEKQENSILTSRLRQNDSFSNIFLKQITRTQQNKYLSTDEDKKKLFDNFHLKTSHQIDFNYMDHQQMIFKTLEQIKEINKENLFVNKKILSAMLQQRKSNKSSKKTKEASYPFVKSTEKKQSMQKNANQKGFSQSRNQFYLYQKPNKASSNRKLSHNKSTLLKKGTENITTHHTKLSLNQNTTKLSLGDRTQPSIKLHPHYQSKSTIKKVKGTKNLSNLAIDDNIHHKLAETHKIKNSLTMFMKDKHHPTQKTVSKASTKKNSKSQFILRC